MRKGIERRDEIWRELVNSSPLPAAISRKLPTAAHASLRDRPARNRVQEPNRILDKNR
jgi:hypothetical protein